MTIEGDRRGRALMAGFAVVDVETTGIYPAGHDRVIELAVVHVDERGRIEGSWETVLNPGRDLGPQSIHGIRSADVLDAPTFEQVAPDLIGLLAGRAMVAHNASFDERFLRAEFDRAGVWGIPPFAPVCTMRLAGELLPGAGRALADCCAACGIEIGDAHRALADARATALLLEVYLASTGSGEPWASWLGDAAELSWPTLARSGAPWKARPDPTAPQPAGFLDRIAERMPPRSGPTEHIEYLALLDRCLIDRHLSATETAALVRLAADLGIDRSTAARLHRTYLDDLLAVARADGVVTAEEEADLRLVAGLLGVEGIELGASEVTASPSAVVPRMGGMRLRAGDLVPWPAVTKKVSVVVAADPDTLSGKARK
ncbi:MAG: exonuclease domain-containing protein, partial [Microbacterium sp.]